MFKKLLIGISTIATLIFVDGCSVKEQKTPITFSVVYDANGADSGNIPVDSKKYVSGDIAVVLGNDGKLVKNKKYFVGWNTSSDGIGTRYIPGEIININQKNIRLFAEWVDTPTYTIMYDANGADSGVAPIDNTNYDLNSKLIIVGNIGNLVKNYAHFGGWNTKTDGTGTTYTQGQEITITSNIILYAKWAYGPSYTITYLCDDAESGVVPVDNTSYYSTMKAIALENTGNLRKTGFAFDGWNTKADGTGIKYNSGSEIPITSSDIILYAVWREAYRIKYHITGATSGTETLDDNYYNPNTLVTIKGDSGNLRKVFTSATEYDYHLKWEYWTTEADGTGDIYSAGDSLLVTNQDINLYPQWGSTNLIYSDHITRYGISGFTSHTFNDELVVFPKKHLGKDVVIGGAFKAYTDFYNETESIKVFAGCEIMENSFNGCINLKQLIVPKTYEETLGQMIEVRRYAFWGSGLEHINLDYTKIYPEAFSNTMNLKTIYLGKYVELSQFGLSTSENSFNFKYEHDMYGYFNGSENIELIDVYYVDIDDKNEFGLESTGEILYGEYIDYTSGTQGLKAVIQVATKNITSVEIDLNVVWGGAFENAKNLSNVSFFVDGKSYTRFIGQRAFWGCSSLTSIEFPNNVLGIGYGILAYCENLETITVSSQSSDDVLQAVDNVLYIYNTTNDYYTVAICPMKKTGSVNLMNNVKFIHHYAFAESKLSNIVFNSVINEFGERAFYNCKNITSMTILGDELIDYNDPDTIIYNYGVFEGMSGLTELTIKNKGVEWLFSTITASPYYGNDGAYGGPFGRDHLLFGSNGLNPALVIKVPESAIGTYQMALDYGGHYPKESNGNISQLIIQNY